MNYLSILILSLSWLLTFGSLQAQNHACYVDERTITTDWRRTDETTNHWDWTARTNPFNLSHTDNLLDYQFTTGTGPLVFTAPFYPFEVEYDPSTDTYGLPNSQGSSGVRMGNVDNFRQSFWYKENPSDDHFKSIDYHPEDGWELIAKSFTISTTQHNTEGYAYFILYNRYAGIIRPFFFIKNNTGGAANKLAIRMDFNGDSDKTALLAHSSPVIPGVQEFIPDQNHAIVTNTVSSNAGYWVYADFPVAYDPCTCTANSELGFELLEIISADIELQGNLITNETIVSSTGAPTSDRSVGLTETASALSSNFAKINKGYKALDGWGKVLNEAEDKAGKDKNKKPEGYLNEAKNTVPNAWEAIGGFLKMASEYNDVIGAVGAVWNLFTGNWQKSKSKSKNTVHLEMDAGVSLIGSLNRQSVLAEVFIRTPGASTKNYSGELPLYDNTLGVFNVLKKPKFKVAVYKPTDDYQEETESRLLEVDAEEHTLYSNGFDVSNFSAYRDSLTKLRNFLEFKLNEPLSYKINPFANVKPKKIMANIQFRIKDENKLNIAQPYYDLTPAIAYGLYRIHHPFDAVGPVLMAEDMQKTVSPNSSFPSAEWMGGEDIPYDAYDYELAAGNTTVEQTYQDLLKVYGGGVEVAQWPEASSWPDNDKVQGIVFQTPVMPINQLHKYSFFVWEPYEKEDLEIVVKTYAFFVPEDDPNREPIVQVFSYQGDWEKISLGKDFYYDFSVSAMLPVVQTYSRGNVTRRSVSPFNSMYSNLLLQPRTSLSLDENFVSTQAIFSDYNQPAGHALVFRESGTIYASEINISTDLILGTSLSGAQPEITIISPNINVSPDVNIPPGFHLIAMPVDGFSDQAELGDIANICGSDEYINRREAVQRIAAPEEEESLETVTPLAHLFPNPARTQSMLRYELEENAQVRISLIDVLGQENILLNSSQAAGTQELSINLSDYPAGLYYCRLMVNGEQRSLPLRVQR